MHFHPRNIQLISFDCYGTLIDWESGILQSLRNCLSRHGIERDDETLLHLYAETEPACQAGAFKPYRQILSEVVMAICSKLNMELLPGEHSILADELFSWKPFADTREALIRLRKKYQLAVISNIDDDLFEGTARQLGIPFDAVITALQVKSYKPSLRNFEFASARLNVARENWLHAAQSLFHDIAPASQLGLQTAWVNRRSGKTGQGAVPESTAVPDVVVPDLKSLADLLEA